MKSVVLASGLSLLFIVACGPAPDSHSGKDYTKSMAKAIEVGQTVDDKVDADTGDNTDWKQFKVEDPGPLVVNVYWDNPGDVTADIALYNGLGVKITGVHHDPDKSTRKDTISLRSVQPGAFFLMIRATKGGSVYTVEVLAGDMTQGSTYGIPRPE